MQTPAPRRARLGWAATAAALAAAAQLACGTTDRQANNDTKRDADARNSSAAGYAPEDLRVNLTGCVERGVIPGSFLLTHVSTAGNRPAQAEGPTGTSGTTGSGDRNNSAAVAGSGAAGDSFTITSGNGSDLGKYVGKRVTVTGRFAPEANHSGEGVGTSGTVASPGNRAGSDVGTEDHGRAPNTGAGSASVGDRNTAGSGAVPERQLTANDIRTVAGSCTPGDSNNPPPRRTP